MVNGAGPGPLCRETRRKASAFGAGAFHLTERWGREVQDAKSVRSHSYRSCLPQSPPVYVRTVTQVR